MTEQLVRLMIVDDHPFFRQGVSLFLDGVEWVDLVGEADNGKKALDILHQQPVDLVLMDLQMPEIDGIETTKQVLEEWPTVKVLVLTSFNSWDQVYQALQAGASGYLLKNAKPEQLLAAIRAAVAGGSYLGTQLARELLERVTRDPDEESQGLSPLTEREVDVLKLIGRGLGNKEIAGELFLSVKTVKTHTANIFAKLELSNRTQAAIYAIRHGLV
ncbi:MAG: response regulator transcription factor [Halanaerobiales bacterium]|nr:response regulator transcription factor [Halanaerobiales bacterium]